MIIDTDLLRAQSDAYRRMSANLYETKRPGEYYHIHGSLEASTTLNMIGLESFRPDLKTHEDIVDVIESGVKKHTTEELEELNARNRQAGVPVLKHEDFLRTPHVREIYLLPLAAVTWLTKEPRAKLTANCRRGRWTCLRILHLPALFPKPVTAGLSRGSRFWSFVASSLDL